MPIHLFDQNSVHTYITISNTTPTIPTYVYILHPSTQSKSTLMLERKRNYSITPQHN